MKNRFKKPNSARKTMPLLLVCVLVFCLCFDSPVFCGREYTEGEPLDLPALAPYEGGDAAEYMVYPDSVVSSSGGALVSAGTAGASFVFDYTSYNISVYSIMSMKITVEMPSGTKEMNVSADGGETLASRYSVVAFETEKETSIILYADGMNFVSGHDFTDLGNSNYKLGVFSVNFRFAEAGEGEEQPERTVKFKSITFKADRPDGIAPEIEYNGPDHLDYTAEKPLVLDEYRAYSEFEGRELPVSLHWLGAEGTDTDGNMIEGGPYTLVLEAADSFDNITQKLITLNVRPRDTEPPVILVNTNEIYTEAGVYPSMLLEALDNEDQVTVETEWITVSLDENGALEEGDHVLRATSTDLTGNVSTMDITVHAVAKGEGYVGKIFRDESKIDFGLGGKILFASLIGLTALLAAAALLIPGRKKESEKQ